NPDEGRVSNGAFATNDGGNGDDVVGVSGMAHPQKETNRENGQSAGHGSCGFMPLRGAAQQLAGYVCSIPENLGRRTIGSLPEGSLLFTVAQNAHQLRGRMRQARSAARQQV